MNTPLVRVSLGAGLIAGTGAILLADVGVAEWAGMPIAPGFWALLTGALLVGSPTLNGQMFPTVADCLTYLKGLRPKNLVGAAFGSYGWSGESVKQVAALLDEMGVEQAAPPLAVKYVPAEADLKACRELGSKVAKALLERTG